MQRDSTTGRFIPGTSEPLIERFWAKVEKSPDPNGCWLWTGARDKAGYGRLSDGRHTTHGLYAHRVSYELHYGPLPPGKFACHHCDVRHCVRPDHLFEGNQADNMADMAAKGRSGPMTHPESTPKGEQHGGARLTTDDVILIRQLCGEGAPYKDVAECFSISEGHLDRIVSGKAWACVPTVFSPRPQVARAMPRGSDSSRSRLTEAEVIAARRAFDQGGITISALAKQYGVHKGTMRRVVRRLNWTHV